MKSVFFMCFVYKHMENADLEQVLGQHAILLHDVAPSSPIFTNLVSKDLQDFHE